MELKRIIFILALAAMPFVGCIADGVKILIVNSKDGTQTSFALADEPMVSCENGELAIVSGNRSFALNLADGKNYLFALEPTGINAVQMDGKIQLENGFIVFSGLEAGSIVTVYTQDGILVRENKADVNGLAVVDMTGLPKGILILKSNKKNIKIINR